MAIDDMDAEQLKDLMHATKMVKANIENWKYVDANSHLVERNQLEHTIEQMLSLIDPIISGLQTALEIEALTKFDPIDLL